VLAWKNGYAHAWKACVTGQAFLNGWSQDMDASLRTITTELQIALALDELRCHAGRILKDAWQIPVSARCDSSRRSSLFPQSRTAHRVCATAPLPQRRQTRRGWCAR